MGPGPSCCPVRLRSHGRSSRDQSWRGRHRDAADRSGDDPAVATSRRGRLRGPGLRGRDPRGPARQAPADPRRIRAGLRPDRQVARFVLPRNRSRRVAKVAGGTRTAHRSRPRCAPPGGRRGIRRNRRPAAAHGVPEPLRELLMDVLVRRRWAPGRALTGIGEAARVLALLLVPNLAQEWLLHVAEVHPWQLTRDAIGRWTVRRRQASQETASRTGRLPSQ